MTQKALFTAAKGTFGRLDVEFLLAKAPEHLPNILEMLLQGRAIAEEVVHIDHHRTMQRAGGGWDSASHGGGSGVGLVPLLTKAARHGAIHDPHEH